MDNIKVFQIGCGKMSKYTMRYAIEKGMQITGAFDINPDVVGKNIGDIMGGDSYGVKVLSIDNLEDSLINDKPDICIVTTMSLLSDCKDVLLLCAKHGVNAITTCEEAFYPMVSNPELTKEIDELASKNNCTISGSGYQDVFWGNLIYTLAGSTHKINMIKGSSSYNVEDYGIALARAHGAGLDKNAFEEQIASADKISDEERDKLIHSGKYTPSYMWNVVPWLANRFGFTLISQRQKCIPVIADTDIYSNTLDMTIKKGDCRGMRAIVTGETEEGITIEAECIGKVYTEDEVDCNEWSIIGEPTTTVVINEPKTVELTCAAIINRIPDVIDSLPGFVPTSNFGELDYIKNL